MIGRNSYKKVFRRRVFVLKVSGMFAPIPTPFNKDEEIDFGKLKENLAKWSRTGLAGVVVLGSNGEFVSLTHEEKVKMIAFVRENLPGEKMLIAGTGCESTRETIQLTREASEAGADAALVINPTYFKGSLNSDVLENHYRKVADASPLPVMIYNMPGNSGINLGAPLITSLSFHENITGVKDSSGNIVQISSVINDSPSDFSVFAGSGSYLLPTLLMGGAGATMAVANVVPEYCVKIEDLYKKGQIDEAVKMQLGLLKLNAAVTSGFGIPGMKYALDRVGYYGGPLRSPLLPPSDDQKKEIDKLLESIDASKWC